MSKYIRVALVAMAAAFLQQTLPAIASSQTLELQKVLDNSGYDAGPATGDWTQQTRSALDAFDAQYGLSPLTSDMAPTESDLANVLAAAKGAVDGAYADFPTSTLDTKTYFAGVSNTWYLNIHNGGGIAVVPVDGKTTHVPVDRFYQPVEADAETFSKSGIRVVREQLGVESALFYAQCDYKNYQGDEGCYAKAFADAKADGWKSQLAALDHLSDNLVVKGYVDGIRFWNDHGFQVIVAPSDFFQSPTRTFAGPDVATGDPDLHAAIMTDPAFEVFFPKFVAAVVMELRKAKLTNIAVQSLNEPRYCNDGQPSAHGLEHWRTEEQSIFDAVRRVAPKVSLISSAICTANVLHSNLDPTFSHLGAVVPIHADMDDVTYAIHIYTPAGLFIQTAQGSKFANGTVFHYPFKKLSPSVAQNTSAQFDVRIYNQMRPDAGLIERRLSNVQAFAASQNINIMITEVGVAKPSFGLPREERIALIGDLLRDSREHMVPILYSSPFDPYGLSDCQHSFNAPDHRFDPALLSIFAFANGVPGASATPDVPPMEATCGPTVQFRARVQINDGSGPTIAALVSLSVAGAIHESLFNIDAHYIPAAHNVASLQLTFHGDELAKGVPAGLSSCKGFPQTVSWEKNPFLVVTLRRQGDTLVPVDGACVLKNIPPALAKRVEQVVNNFAQIASDMISTGDADAGGPALEAWLTDVVDGKAVVQSIN